MKIKFWGVRGSVPTPMSRSQLQGKIAAIVQRITPANIKSQESRELFLANLPDYLIDTVGGNTTCLEVRLNNNDLIIFDAGSGIRNLGKEILHKREKINTFNIFFTHFHWDHVQGLPFFDPAFNPMNTIRFFSPEKDIEKYLKDQMKPPYFPISMDIMASKKKFIQLEEMPISIGNSYITWKKVKHPNNCFSYKVQEGNKSVIFSTDTELTDNDFTKTKENIDYYNNVDLLIIDTQYTLDEAIDKFDWGHSSYSMAIDFAVEWDIKRIVLFHHEPTYNDKKLFSIFKSSKWYLEHLKKNDLEIYLATEDLEIIL